jgi:hypothetical protein
MVIILEQQKILYCVYSIDVSLSEFSSQGDSPSPVVYSHKMDPIFLPPNIGIMTLRSTV